MPTSSLHESDDATARWIDWQLDKYFELSLSRPQGQTSEGLYSGGCRYWWEELAVHWLHDANDEAAQDIVVRVANDPTLQDCLWAISQNPTSQLVASREMVEAARAQEFDTACLRWLGHRPGDTLLQKAAISRRLLALRRKQCFDNLENRVFVYVLDKLLERARNYLVDNSAFQHGTRYRQVSALLNKLARMKATTPCVVKSPLSPSLSLAPNNSLLYDRNYTLVWSLFRQLLLIERLREVAGSYQDTLWRETGRQIIGALLSASASPCRAEGRACVYIKRDMQQGRWTEQPSPPGPFRWGRHILTIYDAWEEGLPDRWRQVLSGLDADQLLVCDRGGRLGQRPLAIWYRHRPFAEAAAPQDFSLRCRLSLERISQRYGGAVAGLIIESAPPAASMSFTSDAAFSALACLKLPVDPVPPQEQLAAAFFMALQPIAGAP